ncbi:MAG: glycyl-radical enzyme activating protein [Anaerolineae bacterium]|nr:glycyl-radical enzyme activating protein [Anaerolineae bacterium]
MTGLVFDIQRCSLHDGPGIRTTVFLKGCQLNCQWCHNPESIAFGPELFYTAEDCIDCLACVAACQFGAQQAGANGTHGFDHARCTACGACVAVCPVNALKLVGTPMTVEAVMAQVERDRDFYRRSGGGGTLSGGEPMMQFAFTRALLSAAKEAGIHTALETNGAAPWEHYAELLPLVDLVLFDFKATDSAIHRQLTGMGNERILENLERLYRAGKPIVLRCPLVPGINDDAGHLRGIAAVSQRYPQLSGIEVMAYHNLGTAKSVRLGATAPLPGLPSATPDQRSRWIETLHALGCAKAQLS